MIASVATLLSTLSSRMLPADVFTTVRAFPTIFPVWVSEPPRVMSLVLRSPAVNPSMTSPFNSLIVMLPFTADALTWSTLRSAVIEPEFDVRSAFAATSRTAGFSSVMESSATMVIVPTVEAVTVPSATPPLLPKVVLNVTSPFAATTLAAVI